MMRLLRVEALKLRSTRLTYGLLALGAVLTALDALLRALRAGNGRLPPLDTAEGLARPLTVTGFAILIAGVLGLTISSGEFRHNTATLTYLAFPDRIRVLVAKTLTGLAGGAIFGAAGAAMTTSVSLAVAAGEGYPISIGTSTIVRDAAGAVLAAALLTAVGVAVGSLIRSQIGATIAILIWAFFLEATIGGLYKQLDPYLPFTAATTLAGSRLGGGGFGFGGTNTAAALPFPAAAGLVIGVLLLISTIAALTSIRRDVT
jgi:ABC-type transport system involved in multi-copper enzyme maturation permease subunit